MLFTGEGTNNTFFSISTTKHPHQQIFFLRSVSIIKIFGSLAKNFNSLSVFRIGNISIQDFSFAVFRKLLKVEENKELVERDFHRIFL